MRSIEAKDTRLDRTVAIKVLPEHLSASEEIKQRFEREAKVISSLSHPNICTLFDVGHDDGVDYLVMEHLEGESLARETRKGPPAHGSRYSPWAFQIADALDKAHKSGVVHRDLKPGNVMLTGEGVKLLDFGLAKYQMPETEVSSASFSRNAHRDSCQRPSDRRRHHPRHVSVHVPRADRGHRRPTPAVDIFALGAVLYEMATGKKAFAGKTQASLIGSIMHSAPEPVSQVVPLAPPAFDRVIQTCLSKEPEERWSNAHDLKLQLQWIAEGGSQVGIPAPVSGTPQEPGAAGMVGGCPGSRNGGGLCLFVVSTRTRAAESGPVPGRLPRWVARHRLAQVVARWTPPGFQCHG